MNVSNIEDTPLATAEKLDASTFDIEAKFLANLEKSAVFVLFEKLFMALDSLFTPLPIVANPRLFTAEREEDTLPNLFTSKSKEALACLVCADISILRLSIVGISSLSFLK